MNYIIAIAVLVSFLFLAAYGLLDILKQRKETKKELEFINRSPEENREKIRIISKR
ncbi:MAG: hypothetical protein N4A40_12060 [Tissierellales bacterium]|nr:hypothetical protein [Tissierellales bacterium]